MAQLLVPRRQPRSWAVLSCGTVSGPAALLSASRIHRPCTMEGSPETPLSSRASQGQARVYEIQFSSMPSRRLPPVHPASCKQLDPQRAGMGGVDVSDVPPLEDAVRVHVIAQLTRPNPRPGLCQIHSLNPNGTNVDMERVGSRGQRGDGFQPRQAECLRSKDKGPPPCKITPHTQNTSNPRRQGAAVITLL